VQYPRRIPGLRSPNRGEEGGLVPGARVTRGIPDRGMGGHPSKTCHRHAIRYWVAYGARTHSNANAVESLFLANVHLGVDSGSRSLGPSDRAMYSCPEQDNGHVSSPGQLVPRLCPGEFCYRTSRAITPDNQGMSILHSVLGTRPRPG